MAELQSNQGRVPPQSLEAERAVLGAMMLEPEAVGRALELVDESNFYRESHRKIFRVMSYLFEKSEPIDQLTVAEELSNRDQLEDIGGAYELSKLLEIPSAANMEYYAKIVLEKSTYRQLINVATETITSAYEQGEDVNELLDRTENAIFRLSDRRLKGGFQSIEPIMTKTMETIESFHEMQGGVTGIATGFADLDGMTSGFQPADLIIIAGRPSMGKTAFALNIARNIALNTGTGVGIFSLEMANYQLAMRLLCSEARVSSHLLRTGRLPKALYSNLSRVVGKLADAPIFIDDTPSLPILELRAKARRLKTEHDIGMIVVDYLQLMRGPKSAESRQQEISEISRALKALAKEIEVPVVALSQLSRAVESRGGKKRPMLSDLRESGAIEQDADVVMFVYRQEHYERDNPELEGKAEIIIGKQRNGPVDTVELTFIKEYAKFEDAARYGDQQYADQAF
ncbi:MAG: Replicative DNA helicase [Candidatus Marinimicrobia bacterium]|nr:Replicative DNA helicase [Candidatus Neomarinimicrobiota bacterium]